MTPRPPPLASAWTSTPASAVAQWAEPLRLTPGATGGGRLRPRRTERGEIDGVEWEEMVARKDDFRLHACQRKTSLLFPATIDESGEGEKLDLVGDSSRFTTDWTMLGNLHHLDPTAPLHPTIFLNSTLREAPPTTIGRINAVFTPSNLNLGNTLAAADIPLPSTSTFPDEPSTSSSMTCVAFRRAGTNDSRPTSVGWGCFTPTRPDERPSALSSKTKGKARAYDEDGLRRLPGGAFVPASTPLWTGNSPVQQVELEALTGSSRPSAVVGIRSLTSFSLLHLRIHDPFDPGAPAEIAASYAYAGASFGGRALADFSLNRGEGLAVDAEGSLFGWGFGGGAEAWQEGRKPEIFRLRKGRKKGQGGYSGFARVQYGGMHGRGAVVAVEDEVLLYDLRSPRASISLVTPLILSSRLPHGASSPSLVTSLLRQSAPTIPSSPSAIHTVCTTRDLLWLDERMPGREALRRAHDRVGFEGKSEDRTLSITELPRSETVAGGGEGEGGEEVQRIALTSRLTPTVEIYTTTMSPLAAPRSAMDPYFLPTASRAPSSASTGLDRFARSGLAFIPLSSSSSPRSSSCNTEDSSAMDVDSTSSSSDDASRSSRQKRQPPKSPTSNFPRPATSKWRLLELGSCGELHCRVFSTSATSTSTGSAEQDAEAAAEEESARVWDEQLVAMAREAEEWSSRRLPGRGQAEKVGGEQASEGGKTDLRGLIVRLRETLADNVEERGNEVREAVQRAQKMVDQLGEGEGEVGALTALEAVSIASSAPHRQQQQPQPNPFSVMLDDDAEPEELEPPFPNLPRDSAYIGGTTCPLGGMLEEAALSSAPSTTILLEPAVPPTQFSTLLPRPPPAPLRLASNASANRLAASEAAQARLASQIILPRAIEPDEPTMTPNQPQPGDLDPPQLHFSYFRPKDSTPLNSDAEDDEADMLPTSSGRRRRGRKSKPPPPLAEAWGARLLLAEWHVGADPRSYAWSNPYEGETEKKGEAGFVFGGLQSVKGRKSQQDRYKENALYPPSSSQFGTSQPFASAFPSSSFPQPSQSQPFPPTYSSFPPFASQNIPPPSSQAFLFAPSHARDPPSFAASQPAISITAPADESLPASQSFSQVGFGSAATQVVPGAFGSRSRLQEIRERKKEKGGKKRKAGF
ncbi:hypothetical protein JCM11641_003796 [Rhodosporidiobolus odoratus]